MPTELTRDAFDAFLEMCKCPVCLDVMTEPVIVIACFHKFCKNCIENYIGGKKKECPVCRTSVGCRRMLVKDTKMEEMIKRLIPNAEDFHTYEECEAKRHFKSESTKRLKEYK